MKYWLIADSTVDEIKSGLTAQTHAINDYNCEDWPPGDGCAGCRGDESRRSALHALESGLHTTSEIPWDMKGLDDEGELKPEIVQRLRESLNTPREELLTPDEVRLKLAEGAEPEVSDAK